MSDSKKRLQEKKARKDVVKEVKPRWEGELQVYDVQGYQSKRKLRLAVSREERDRRQDS